MVSILLGLAMPPKDVEARIVSASLFKNGYAMVLREIDVADSAILSQIPVSSLGTLWLTSSAGVKIKAVVNTTRETVAANPIGSIGEYLRLNKGKQVQITYQAGGTAPAMLAGTIVEVAGELAFVRSANETVAVRVGSITMATIAGEAKTSMESKGSERVLKFQTEGTGKIYMIGLERGMMWSPGYTIDISNSKELRLLAKSTVINDLGVLDKADLKFVTGFPNVPWANLNEPLLSGESMQAFVNMLQSLGTPTTGFAGRRDSQMLMNQAAAPTGGFLGGEMEVSGTGGEMAEDLFFYAQPAVSLQRGDRAFYVLFEAKAPFEHLYTLEIPNTINEYEGYNPNPNQRELPYDVWHTIKFANSSKQPLTTAPATVYKDGQIMGQDTVMYTSAGADLSVKMSKALDVQNDASEEETARERGALKTSNYGNFDLVTIKGTVVLRNRKSEAVKLKVTKMLQGELVMGDNAVKQTKVAKGLREVNPRTKLEWNLTVPSAKSVTLNYTYKVYVRA